MYKTVKENVRDLSKIYKTAISIKENELWTTFAKKANECRSSNLNGYQKRFFRWQEKSTLLAAQV